MGWNPSARPWTAGEEAILREEMARGRGWIGRAMARLGRGERSIKTKGYRDVGAPRGVEKPWYPPTQKGRLRPGQASVARQRRRQAMRQ